MARSVVRYWEKWGGQEERAMREIVSAFNHSQDRFFVEMEPAGDWSSSPDLPRFLAAQSSGNTPDIIGLEDHQVVDLAHENVPAPLHRCAGDIFLPAFERLGKVGGIPYAVPVSVNIATLYVNLKALPAGDRAGWAEKGKPSGSPSEVETGVTVQRDPGGTFPFPTDIRSFDDLLRRIEAEGRVGMILHIPAGGPGSGRICSGAWFRDGGLSPTRPPTLEHTSGWSIWPVVPAIWENGGSRHPSTL